MLRFLSLLFATPPERPESQNEALIQQAIERAVEGTDRRIRALGNYRKRLREPVARAVSHVIALVDALPGPVEISPRTFGGDPSLRAFFVSADHMREVFGGFQTVRDYLADLSGPRPERVFGLLTMSREERCVFAMELAGDDIRRDVMQVAVNFFNHRYLGPAANEVDSRRELKKRAFDFLIERTLERIAGERNRRRELDRQKHLLHRKLVAMKSGCWGLGAMLGESERQHPDLSGLEAEIDGIEAELGQCPTDSLSLEDSLECVADTLSRPEDWLGARSLSLRLDYRGIKVSDSSATVSREVLMTELFSGAGETRTVLFGSIPLADMPEPPDMWEKAKRYLASDDP